MRSWRDIASLWASIEALQGGEHLEAMRLEARASHRITVRHRSGIRPGMRMLRAGTPSNTPFNLRSVVDLDGRRRFLSVLAEEGVAT